MNAAQVAKAINRVTQSFYAPKGKPLDYKVPRNARREFLAWLQASYDPTAYDVEVLNDLDAMHMLRTIVVRAGGGVSQTRSIHRMPEYIARSIAMRRHREMMARKAGLKPGYLRKRDLPSSLVDKDVSQPLL